MSLSLFQRLQLKLIYAFIDVLVVLETPRLLYKLLPKYFVYISSAIVLIYFAFNVGSYRKDISYIFEYFYYVPSTISIQRKPKARIPRHVNAIPFPKVSAQGILVADLRSDYILYERNKNTKFPPASTTKIMTALVAKEMFSKDSVFVVDYYCSVIPSQKAGFYIGETLKLDDLLRSLLISSAGDAACVLSQNHSPISFVSRMNMLANSLGMKNTRFSNAIGLDDFDNGQESTPYDLYLLTKKALSDEFISSTVKIKELDIESIESSSSIRVQHHLVNTNKLLWEIPETIGFKTGRTDGAGEVLVYVYSKDEKEVAIIVMKSLNRFDDTKNILDWVISSYEWE